MKVKLLVELEYDEAVIHTDDFEGLDWFHNQVLGGSLVLVSDEIGDEIGEVTLLEVLG